MNLLALQRNLRDHLIQGSADIGREISGDSSARLAVYHHAYRAHLMDCLRDTFERVWTWLGDAGFEAAGQKHIELHPPHGWTLADYGNGFDRTLKSLFPTIPSLPSWHGSIGRYAELSMARTRIPSKPWISAVWIGIPPFCIWCPHYVSHRYRRTARQSGLPWETADHLRACNDSQLPWGFASGGLD